MFKITKLSRFVPYMVANSRFQMNKFLYKLSNSVEIEFRNAILLENMNISRIMTHTQQFERNKLKEHAKENKKDMIDNYDYFQ